MFFKQFWGKVDTRTAGFDFGFEYRRSKKILKQITHNPIMTSITFWGFKNCLSLLRLSRNWAKKIKIHVQAYIECPDHDYASFGRHTIVFQFFEVVLKSRRDGKILTLGVDCKCRISISYNFLWVCVIVLMSKI